MTSEVRGAGRHPAASRYRRYAGSPVRSAIERGSSAVPLITTSSRDCRQRRPQPLRPLDDRDAGRLAVVEQPAGERVRGVVEAVQVEVEQRQPALVLGHEHERRGRHDVGHAEAGREPLGELRLARAELADEAHEVPGARDGGQPATQGTGGGGVVGRDDELGHEGDGHRSEGSRTHPATRRRGRRAASARERP